MPGGPDTEGADPVRRTRRRRLRDSYKQVIDQGQDTSIVYVMKVLNNVNEIGILIDASFSWIEHEIQRVSKLGYDTSTLENRLREFEKLFENNLFIESIGTIEELAIKIKNYHIEYFQNGSSMIISSIKRRMMEYESIGVNVSPVRKVLQDAIEAIKVNDWEYSWAQSGRINKLFTQIELAVEEGTEEGLDLKEILENIPDPTWDVDTYLAQIDERMGDIPIDDTEKTVGVLGNIKKRIMDAKANGKDVDRAIDKFKMSEPEIKEANNLKALIWAKVANDELLLLEN